VIAVVFSRDPVAKAVAKALGLTDLLTAGLSTRRVGDLIYVAHGGDSTELWSNWEEQLAGMGVEHVVVLSRHEMARPRPMVTAHTPGVGELSVAYAELKSWLLREACAERPEGYDCSAEATHHEPDSRKLSVTFLEVGSTEAEWGDERAARALARAVAELPSFKPSGAATAMAVGDLHYSMLTGPILEGRLDVGHIIRKDVATPELAAKAFYKHINKPSRVVFFKKSFKAPLRGEILSALQKLGVEIDIKS
jgi:D-aminoacyl-tRNA deacylase